MPVNTFHEADDELKKILRCLLIARGQESMTIRNLASDYKEETDENIPYQKFGFATLTDYLYSIPEFVEVYEQENTIYVRHVDSANTAHISQLVSKQKPVSKVNPRKGRKTFRPSNYYPQGSYAKNRIPANILSRYVRLANEYGRLSKDWILDDVHQKVPELHITMEDLNEQLGELRHELHLHDTHIRAKCNSRHSTPNNSKLQSLSPFPRNNALYTQQKTPNRPMFKKCENPNVQYTVPEDKQNSEDEDYAVKNCEKKNSVNGRNDVYKSNNDEDSSSSLDQEDSSILISPDIKSRLGKLIEKNPDGIWAVDLPELYLTEYKIPLNYKTWGFSNVIELVQILPEIFKYVVHPVSKKLLLLNAKLENVPNFNDELKQDGQSTSSSSQEVPSGLSRQILKKLIPTSAMGYEETVQQISVMEVNMAFGSYEAVVLSEIYTPSMFWIRLNKKKKEFDAMMSELHDFYFNIQEKFKIPRSALTVGLNVACTYCDIWHRAVVKNIGPDGCVTVMFYDYGTLKTYKSPQLYFLDKTFSSLPAQAIPCGLYNLKPIKSSKWSQEVISAFVKKVDEKPMMARVSTVDIENNALLVSLTDTSNEHDLHLDDWMIKNKFAEPGHVMTRLNNFLHRFSIECQELKHRASRISKPKTVKSDPHPKLELVKKYMKSRNSTESKPSEKVKKIDGSEKLSEILQRLKKSVGRSDSSSEDLKSSCNSSDVQEKRVEVTKATPIEVSYSSFDAPLHFKRPLTAENSPDMETFRSVNGGCGRMEPMDWSAIDAPPKIIPKPVRKDMPKAATENQTLINENAPEPNGTFVNFVENTVPKDGILWTPNGNITSSQRPVTSLLRKMEIINNIQNLKMMIPRPVLNMFHKDDEPSKVQIQKSDKPNEMNKNDPYGRSEIETKRKEPIDLELDDGDFDFYHNGKNMTKEAQKNAVKVEEISNAGNCTQTTENVTKRNMTILREVLKNLSSSSELDSDDLSKLNLSEPNLQEVSTRFFTRTEEVTSPERRSPVRKFPVFNDRDLDTDESEWDYGDIQNFPQYEQAKNLLGDDKTVDDGIETKLNSTGQESSLNETTDAFSSSVNASISSNLSFEEEPRRKMIHRRQLGRGGSKENGQLSKEKVASILLAARKSAFQ